MAHERARDELARPTATTAADGASVVTGGPSGPNGPSGPSGPSGPDAPLDASSSSTTPAALVSAYLEGDLDDAGRARVEAWMGSSPEARREVEQMRKVLSLVRGLSEVRAPQGFAERVERRFRRERAFGEGFAGAVLGVPLQVFAILVLLAVAAIQLTLAVDRDAKGIKVEDEAPRSSTPAQLPGDITPGPTP